jgi:hypothetical protein
MAMLDIRMDNSPYVSTYFVQILLDILNNRPINYVHVEGVIRSPLWVFKYEFGLSSFFVCQWFLDLIVFPPHIIKGWRTYQKKKKNCQYFIYALEIFLVGWYLIAPFFSCIHSSIYRFCFMLYLFSFCIIRNNNC